jgi:hypothetical protein
LSSTSKALATGNDDEEGKDSSTPGNDQAAASDAEAEPEKAAVAAVKMAAEEEADGDQEALSPEPVGSDDEDEENKSNVAVVPVVVREEKGQQEDVNKQDSDKVEDQGDTMRVSEENEVGRTSAEVASTREVTESQNEGSEDD